MDRHRPALTRRWALLLAVPPLAFLGLFFLWPVANILALGIAPEGQLQLGHVLETWTQPFVLDTVVFTLALALSSTLLTLLVVPVAYTLVDDVRALPARAWVRVTQLVGLRGGELLAGAEEIPGKRGGA